MFTTGSRERTPEDAGVYRDHSDGCSRRSIIGRSGGSVHQEVAIVELAPGGYVERHLHAFEEGAYVLEGSVSVSVAGNDEELGADDYWFVEKGIAHRVRNDGASPARWLEVLAPQPGAALDDTVFDRDGIEAASVETPFHRGHFELASLPPPSSAIGLAGFGGANVGGASLEIILGPDAGASQFNLMVVQYAPGGLIKLHDHAFEEGFFFLTGEIEAQLEESTHTLKAGDYCWSGVGSAHALVNRSPEPVRWLETQVPQPPRRHQARFFGDWEKLVGG
jgi:quercetin dioxygenase-like cupin family protein